MTTANPPCSIVHLGPQHLQLMEGVNTLFGQVFGDKDTYCKHRPRPEYLQRLLARDSFVGRCCTNAGRS